MMQPIDILQLPLPAQIGETYVWQNLHGASIGLILHNSILQSKKPVLIIAADSALATRLMEEIQFFSHQQHQALYFPDRETLPYDYFSPHQDIISERLATLYHASLMKTGAILTTVPTLMHRLPPKEYIYQYSFVLKVGDSINIDILKTQLLQTGYH